MTHIRIEAQQLQAGDIVGSGETIVDVVRASIHFPSNKVMVTLKKNGKERTSYWGKHAMINVERPELPTPNRSSHCS